MPLRTWKSARAPTTNHYNTMLKERVIELLNGYEHGEFEGEKCWLTAGDVQEGIEEAIDEEPYDGDLNARLNDALREYAVARYESDRGGGRIPDGSDEFIDEVKRIVGYES